MGGTSVVELDAPLVLEVGTGERWWGGDQLPLTVGDEARIGWPRPLLVSTHGRYVWSREPFVVRIRDSALTVLPGGAAPVESGVAALGSLRAAYRAGAARFDPPVRRPAARVFTMPHYVVRTGMPWELAQHDVLRYAYDLRRYGFPPGVIVVDEMWAESHGDWRFHSGRFPDPAAMVGELHELGFAVMVWVVPYVTPDTSTFRALADRGALLTDGQGRPVLGQWRSGRSAALDLLNPLAAEHLDAQLTALRARSGVDGFLLDGGEPLFYADIGAERPVQNARAWVNVGVDLGLSDFCAATGGDGSAENLIAAGIGQGLMGNIYAGPGAVADNARLDGDGFDQDRLVRSVQVQAMSPIMRLSTAPWQILDDCQLRLCVEAASLHVAHGHQMLRLAIEAQRTGEPIQRHLAYVFPDHGYEGVTDQFMLGEDIVVAPVLEPGRRQRVVEIPPGTWLGDDGSEFTGPASVEIVVPLSRLPRFYRVREHQAYAWPRLPWRMGN